MPTTRQIVEQQIEMFSPVPKVGNDFVCKRCLGPVQVPYTQCYACSHVFQLGSAPAQLRGAVVPMTSSLNPSRWYTWLQTYKSGYPARGAEIGALTFEYIRTHARTIKQLLGGEQTMLTIVPSKRGLTYATQPLRRALARVPPLRELLRHCLTFGEGSSLGRWTYNPAVYEPGPTSVSDERVILIEDSWVTGASALSAAGALLEHGAESVVIL